MNQWLVAIDPEHGGKRPGACYFGEKEKNMNLQMAYLVAGALLQLSEDIRPMLLRAADTDITMESRVAEANMVKANLYIQISHNAGKASGFESFRHVDAFPITKLIQEDIHKTITLFYEKYSLPDRGMKRGYYYVLRETNMPALILELGFMDNIDDMTILTDSEKQYELARYIARGIVNAWRKRS